MSSFSLVDGIFAVSTMCFPGGHGLASGLRLLLDFRLSTCVITTKGNYFSSALLRKMFLRAVEVDSVLPDKAAVPVLGRHAQELKTIEEYDGKIHCTAASTWLADSR